MLRVALAAILALFFSTASMVRAQAPGTLDLSFNAGTGNAIISMGVTQDGWRAVVIQPDGKIVAAGTCVSSSLKQFCLARFASDGTIDSTFGTAGKQFTTIGSADASAIGLALQPDGKIVLAGSCGPTNNAVFCVARYLSTGALDTLNFGVNGVVVAPAVAGVTNAVASGMAQQGDGKIVVAGTCGTATFRFCVGRFTAVGALDTSFAAVGVTTTVVGSASSVANAVVLQPDGYVVLGGQCTDPGLSLVHFCLVRYASNGNPDSLFGSGGIFIGPMIGISSGEILYALALQPDGKLVAGGQCITVAGGVDFCLMRVNAVGTADTTFGSAGKVTVAISGGTNADQLYSLLIMPDGRIVTAGGCFTAGGSEDMCVARHNPDGSIDPTFGTAGKTVSALSVVADFANAGTLQADGKLVFAGHCIASGPSGGGYCIARYSGGPFGYRTCSLDLDGDGRVLATTDVLMQARIALGMSGTAVTNGIAFAANATRSTWADIRTYLVTQCGMTLP